MANTGNFGSPFPPRVPDPVQQQFQQAVGLHQQGRLADAEKIYQAILKKNPRHFDALHMLGVMAFQTGKIERGIQLLIKAAGINPMVPPLHSNLANAYLMLRRFKEALASADKAVQLSPTFAEAWNNRAVALQELGRLDEALASNEKAIAARPNYPAAFNIRGIILRDLKRPDEALANYDRAIALAPEFPDAHYNRANLLLVLNRPEDALIGFDAALRLRPDYAEAYNSRSIALSRLNRAQDAIASAERAIALKPDYADAYNNLGNVFSKIAFLAEARANYETALRHDPKLVEAQTNLSNILTRLGLIDDAIAHYKRALKLDPTHIDGHRNLLVALTFHPTIDLDTYFAEHRRFDEALARPHARAIKPHRNAPNPNRKLRIGYLSSDLRDHTIARSLLPVIRDHARTDFALYFYAEVARPDATTERFQTLADGWCSTIGKSDQEVAEQIREDGIDILISLAGRFDANRPLVCAYKPAPIQISFHDVATSGLTTMDYLIADRTLVPHATRERFTERVLAMPHFYLAQMPSDLPEIAAPSDGPIMFGCLNNPAKISADVLDLWGQAMAAIPDSRLTLRYFNAYEAAGLRERVETALAKHGVDPARILYPGSEATHAGSLTQYNAIDIALDTFPFSGSTTTFDALLMGVPVVTLPGDRMVSRWSAAMLKSLGLSDLIAQDADDYVTIVRRLADDTDGRAALRRTLRGRVAASPLCDHQAKTRALERIYHAVWRRWCAAPNA